MTNPTLSNQKQQPPLIDSLDGWQRDDHKLTILFSQTVRRFKSSSSNSIDDDDIPPHQRLHLFALFKQATVGDAPSHSSSSDDKNPTFHALWHRLRGTPPTTAKRRYITLLQSLSSGIVSLRYETGDQPVDFPRCHLTRVPICARCNSKNGCRGTLTTVSGDPLLDDDGTVRLPGRDDGDELLNVNDFCDWYHRHAASSPSSSRPHYLRCENGLHMRLSTVDVKPFRDFYSREDVGGFQPFDVTEQLRPLVTSVIYRHYQLFDDRRRHYHDMLLTNENSSENKMMRHAARAELGVRLENLYQLHEFYRNVVAANGETLKLSVPCRRRNDRQCHARRIAANGVNHSHLVSLPARDDPAQGGVDEILPPLDFSVYDDAVSLRTMAVSRYGCSPVTGGPMSTTERCEVFERRMEEVRERRRRVETARMRRVRREERRPWEKRGVKMLSEDMTYDLMECAVVGADFESMMMLSVDRRRRCSSSGDGTTLAEEGAAYASVNHETKRASLTPLIQCAIHGNKKDEAIRFVNDGGAIVDYRNNDGMTALMWACQMDNLVMVYVLLDLGARPDDEGYSSNNDGTIVSGRRTALSVAVQYGRKQALEIMIEWIRDTNDEGAVRQMLNGSMSSSLLILCARYNRRNMARMLMRWGCSLNSTVDGNGDTTTTTVVDVAYRYGWHRLADWFKMMMESSDTMNDDRDEQEEREENIAMASLVQAVKDDNVDDIVQIVKDGLVPPDHELLEPCGSTLLMIMVERGHVDGIRRLLPYCDVGYKNRYNRTALMVAVSSSTTSQNSSDNVVTTTMEIILLLLDRDETCLETRDIDGRRALTLASDVRKMDDDDDDGGVIDFLLTCRKQGVRKTINDCKTSPITTEETVMMMTTDDEGSYRRDESALKKAVAIRWEDIPPEDYCSWKWRLVSSKSELQSTVPIEDEGSTDDDSNRNSMQFDGTKKEKRIERCHVCTLPLPCDRHRIGGESGDSLFYNNIQ